MEVDSSIRVDYMNRPKLAGSHNFRQQQRQPTQFKPSLRNNGQPQQLNFTAFVPQQPRFHAEELTNTNHDYADSIPHNY